MISMRAHAASSLKNSNHSIYPDHAIILGGDLQGSWSDAGRKSNNIRQCLLYRRLDGPPTPTYIPPHQPTQETGIDHFARSLDNSWIKQCHDTTVLTPASLDHRAVIASIEIPIPPAAHNYTVQPLEENTATSRKPATKLEFPIPKPALATWRCAAREASESRCRNVDYNSKSPLSLSSHAPLPPHPLIWHPSQTHPPKRWYSG